MKVVIQRVSWAQIVVDGVVISEIHQGILAYLGVAKGDHEEKLTKLIQKVCELRIFEDFQGKMNRSLKEVQGSLLIVSQFTLLANCSQGRRPSFGDAESPELAKELYLKAIHLGNDHGIPTFGGQFQADMKVHSINDGPCTILLEV